MARIITGVLVAFGLLVGAKSTAAQGVDAVTAAYYRAASQAFRVPESEVLILAEWGLPPDELPVVLSVARQTRVSPDAVIGMRRGGSSWADILSRHSIGIANLHVEFSGAPPAPVADVYRQLAVLPRERWGEVQLRDDHVIFLVNVRFLADHVRTDPDRVAEVRARSAGFPATYRALIGG